MHRDLRNSSKELGTSYNIYQTSLLLPTCTKKSCPDLDTIYPETLSDLLQGKIGTSYEKVIIVDCRYNYEFEGGHIVSAINVNQTRDIEEMYTKYLSYGRRICIIFHCEFSSHRGPKMYRHFRNFDRNQNLDKYPHLEYPELYLLEGGYKIFYEKFKHHCNPLGYIEMNDPNYMEELKAAHKQYTRDSRKFRSRSCSDLRINRASRKKRALQDRSETRVNLFGSTKCNLDMDEDVDDDLLIKTSMDLDIDDIGGEMKSPLRSSCASMPDIDLSYRAKIRYQ